MLLPGCRCWYPGEGGVTIQGVLRLRRVGEARTPWIRLSPKLIMVIPTHAPNCCERRGELVVLWTSQPITGLVAGLTGTWDDCSGWVARPARYPLRSPAKLLMTGSDALQLWVQGFSMHLNLGVGIIFPGV